MGTVVLMLKTQIGLGVLSIPSSFDALGLIPGVICLLSIGGIITWGMWVVGVFKQRHPDVYSIVDVGEKLGGRIGQEFMSVAFMLCRYHCPPLHEILANHFHSVGLCGRLGHVQYIYCFQRTIYSRRLHCDLHRRGGNHRIPHR